MAAAVNLAIINKIKTGKGQKVDIAILDSLFSVLEEAQATYEFKGKCQSRSGNAYPSMAPSDTLKTKDGYVTVAVSSEKQWKSFCQVLNLQDLFDNEDYKTNELRVMNYKKSLKTDLENAFSTISKHEIEEKLNAAGVSASAVRNVGEAINNEQIVERKVIREVEDKRLGKITYPGPVINMSKTPGSIDTTAPLMGEDTEFYLRKIGYSDNEISRLTKMGIVETVEEVKL
jgi:CoA:oxalate CoA-transferase